MLRMIYILVLIVIALIGVYTALLSSANALAYALDHQYIHNTCKGYEVTAGVNFDTCYQALKEK